MIHRGLASWKTQLALAAVALAVVLAAPLASPNRASADVTIAGARSLSDQVSVSFDRLPPGHTAKQVHLLAFNDLHGTLDPMSQTQYGQFAGGAAFLAKKVTDLQAQYGAYQATIFAGDNIGASPLASALFHDEPTVVASNLMNVDFASVGNHEFDEGSAELLRMQNGGCHPIDGCDAAPYALAGGGTTNTFPGADFQYLSANVVVNTTGKTLFPPYAVKQFSSTDGKRKYKLGFIGETLEATPTIVTPAGVAGLTFLDEAEAANKAVAELADQGVKIPILVVHQGGFQSAPAALNGCGGNLAGSDIAEIAGRLDPSIKVIVSAHTHAEYRCTITAGGVTRLITSASSFGRILSDLTLTIDENNDKLLGVDANNILIRNATNTPGTGVVRSPDLSLADPGVQALVGQYVAAAAPLANQVIGRIQGDLTPAQNVRGESTIGDVIADAQLAATAPAGFGEAKLAFMNPGGIRGGVGFLVNGQVAGTEGPGEVTYGEAFTVQPFGNSLVTKTMTGDQIRSLLEQQYVGCGGQTTQRILQISVGFAWVRNASAPACADKVSGLALNGTPIDPAATYRVTMNNFLASGGDGFTVFNQGTNALGGAQDIDALVAYFGSFLPGAVPNPPMNRITGA